MTDLLKAVVAIVGLLLVALLAAWLVMGKPWPTSGSARQADPQATPTPALGSGPAIPQLDTAAPAPTETAGIETATFALG